LRIKVNPEDFQVEEILSVPLLETGAAQRVYRLKKRNWNTVDALTRISDSKGVALRDLNWCGRKDKAALTVQYFSTYVRQGHDVQKRKRLRRSSQGSPLTVSALAAFRETGSG